MQESIEDQNNLSLYQSAELLRGQHKNMQDFVLAVGKFIIDHANTFPEVYNPKSILESQFTPVEEAFEKGMLSCGAIVNMATAMLRHVGLRVKLIHGESADSVDHSWISVLDPETNMWVEYDLTEEDGIVPPTNIKKLETGSWDDIKNEILADHSTLEERRKERGL